MTMTYDSDYHRSRCLECGYACPGHIVSCPQCKQLELLKRQAGSASGSSGGFESSLIGYGIGAVVLVAIIGFLLELAYAVIKFIVDALNALWNLILTPFVFVANVTGLSVGFSALLMFGGLAAFLIYAFSSNESDAGAPKKVKPRRSNSNANRQKENSSKPLARKRRFKSEAVLDKEEVGNSVSTRRARKVTDSGNGDGTVKQSVSKPKSQAQSETPVRKRSKAQKPAVGKGLIESTEGPKRGSKRKKV
jgi:hypothetical protein